MLHFEMDPRLYRAPEQDDEDELPPGEERTATDASNLEEDGPPGTEAEPLNNSNIFFHSLSPQMPTTKVITCQTGPANPALIGRQGSLGTLNSRNTNSRCLQTRARS